MQKPFSEVVPPDADVSSVAKAIAKVVDALFGKRPSSRMTKSDRRVAAGPVTTFPVQGRITEEAIR